MTNIFSLVKESSIPKSMFSSVYANENFFESSIEMLESFEDGITNDITNLYKVISESNNVKEENDAIKEFIISAQDKLDDLIGDINFTASKFDISLNNYCDNAKERVKYISAHGNRAEDISYTSPYTIFKVDNLMNSSIPRMNPYKIFETEFLNIAEMLQNLPVTISNKDKLEVVATVYDKFKSNFGEITKSKIYENLFGTASIRGSFSATSLSLFKEESKGDYNITYKEYSDAVECISDSSIYVDTIDKMTKSLVNDLKHIIDDINEIILGAAKNKYKVDTKQDGIRNTTYSTDIYTSNKIMWLVEEKIQQIADVYDKYILALSIKIDCILSYIKQSSDIISSFAFAISENICAPTDSKIPIKNDEEETEDEDDYSDSSITYIDNDDTSDTDDEEDDDEEDEEDSYDYNLEDDEVAPDFEAEGSEDEELQEAVREFYMSLHEFEMASNRESILESSLSIIREETKQTSSNYHSMKNVKSMVNKAGEEKKSAWKMVIGAAKNLWGKFKDNIINRYDKKVDKLKANVKYINLTPLDHEISMNRIYHDKINQIRVPDLNWDSMKDNLNSEVEFMNSDRYLKKFVPAENNSSSGGPKTISQMVIDFIIDPDSKIKNSKELDPSKIYNEYCKNFIGIMDRLKDITNAIEKGERQANIIAKNLATNEQSEFADPLQVYFTEKFEAGPDNSGKENATDGNSDDKKDDGESKKSSNDEAKLKVYFSTCGKILAAKMTVCEKVFNEYYAYLMWHIGKKRKGISSENKKANAGSSADQTVTNFD